MVFSRSGRFTCRGAEHVEAWLLQNTVDAARICSEEHGEPAHLDAFERFRADRALLDEIVKPKEATCLGSKHNRALTDQGFPAREVEAVGKSFHASVEALRGCSDLVAALGATHP